MQHHLLHFDERQYVTFSLKGQTTNTSQHVEFFHSLIFTSYFLVLSGFTGRDPGFPADRVEYDEELSGGLSEVRQGDRGSFRSGEYWWIQVFSKDN